jgi:hypothetical protein
LLRQIRNKKIVLVVFAYLTDVSSAKNIQIDDSGASRRRGGGFSVSHLGFAYGLSIS